MAAQSTTYANPDAAAAVASRSLVSLLGVQRATIVQRLRTGGDATVAELADHLDVSEVATRRHLAVLEGDGLVDAHKAAHAGGIPGRGRPPARYRLTPLAAQLFPHAYDRLASDMMEFLADQYGPGGMRAFLRWRLEREVATLSDAVTADDLGDRLEQLAGALSQAGFAASVTPQPDGFTLTQEHCAIYDVAKDHPELCSYEAATFSRVLGHDVTLSRRETLTAGSTACVCAVAARTDVDPGLSPVVVPDRTLPLVD